MIRCYMGADRVAGFGHEYIKALIEPLPEGPDAPAAQPGSRIMHGPDAAPFQALRTKMETEWVPQMIDVLGLDSAALPIIWDADFLYGPRDATGADSYMLCEINVSSSSAIPDEAPAPIAKPVPQRPATIEVMKVTRGWEPNRLGLAQTEQESDARGQQQHQDHAPKSSFVETAEQVEARPCP